MRKTIVTLSLALILSPSFAFAATSNQDQNQQYISFLKQEIIQLEIELASLIQSQASDQLSQTPPEAPVGAVASSTGSIVAPATTTPNYTPAGDTLPSVCYNEAYFYSKNSSGSFVHEECHEFEG